MTSAAYGVGQHTTAGALAEGCPVSPFFAATARLGVLPGEERAHPARPELAFWALAGLYVGVGCSDVVAAAVPVPDAVHCRGLARPSGPWMALSVHGHQVGKINGCIDLGGCQVSMPQ